MSKRKTTEEFKEEVRSMHYGWNMVGCDAPPVCDAAETVLISTAVSAVWVTRCVTDHDGYIGVIDILVHDHVVAALCISKVHQVLIVFTVVACEETVWIELVEELLSKNLLHLLLRCTWMESVGDDEEDVLLLYSYAI